MEWWKKIPDAWKLVTVIVAAVALVIGSYRQIDGYVTKRCDFEEHKKKHNTDIAEVSDAARKGFIYQDMRWNSKEQYEIKKRLEKNPNSEADQEYLEKLKLEKEQMQRELRDIGGPKEPDSSNINIQVK